MALRPDGFITLLPDPEDLDQLVPSFALPRPTRMRLPNIPMPPSANNLYPQLRSGVRVKSKEYRLWEKNFADWALEFSSWVRTTREALKALTPTQVLHLEAAFFFPMDQILTKARKPKRNDTSNRLKALHDGLATLLGFDDCLIFDGSFKKRICFPGVPAHVNVEFSVLDIPQSVN